MSSPTNPLNHQISLKNSGQLSIFLFLGCSSKSWTETSRILVLDHSRFAFSKTPYGHTVESCGWWMMRFFFGNWQPFHLGMYYCIKKHCKLWGIVWRLMRFNDSARLKYQYRSKVVIIFSRWYRWWFHVFYFQLGKWSWPIFVQMGWFNHHLVMVCVFSSSECHCGFSKVSKGDETFKHINNHGSHCQLWWLIQPS